MTSDRPVCVGKITCVALLASFAVCCSRPQVVAFSVPDVACPGQEVSVAWQVRGAASLRAERGPQSWDEGVVPSEGQRKLMATENTTFTLRALDADPAQKDAYSVRPLAVPRLDEERVAPADCSGPKCTGSFELSAAPGLRVSRLSAPSIVAGGQLQPATVCVTPPGAARTCVAPSKDAALDVLAAGQWQLEAELPSGVTVPPQLHIHLDFRCR